MELVAEAAKAVGWFLCGVGATTVYYRLRGFHLAAKR